MTVIKKLLLLLACATIAITTACGGESGGGGSETPKGEAKLSAGESVAWDATSQFLQITAAAGQQWTASISGGDWCRFSSGETTISGSGSGSKAVYYDRNSTTSPRSATLTVSFEGANTLTLTLTQAAYAATGTSTAQLSRTAVGWNDDDKTVTVTISSNVKWTLSVTDDWLWFDYESYNKTTSGQGNASVTLYFASNGTSAERTAYIDVAFAGQAPFKLTLKQAANGQQVTPPDTPDYGKKSWAELPAIDSENGMLYVTHTASNGSRTVRNYTLCYDTEYKLAHWVAYPLHKCYVGGNGRTDAWSYDPQIPVSAQANMEKGMGNGYDRGHQIPSGDRTASRALNVQTFYYTNMTAQVGRGLNQDVWANLENKLRDDYMCNDTLYVVTGCVIRTQSDPNVKWVNNRNGGKVVVPKAYFKVLLRTKAGNSGQAVNSSNATTIGFWYENRAYSHSAPRAEDAKSVSEIEQLTGFTFFPQISDAVKSRKDTQRWGL